ncbi:hypothetical protein POVWA1_046750 [Plasmodium ovale wallikeri]|uniref:Leucine-rich repeat protein n=1 Tax=Plasmodium ovale wallikeri TaxID=864142 RepID=A0A1A8ZG31_PLAOA|nr:hypothetical protein POVWA1_046750 [Plasmodium ovale wallikeri]
MDRSAHAAKGRLSNLNELFLSTTDHVDVKSSSEKRKFIDSNGVVVPNEHTKGFHKNWDNYVHKFDNIQKKEKEKNELKLVSSESKITSIIDPSYIREKNFGNYDKYVNVSFVNHLTNKPKDETFSRQRDHSGRKYDSTYKNTNRRNNYEYISATNEYYIATNVEEKMTNTGITTENFFADNNMLQYDGQKNERKITQMNMKKWSDKSRYLYFVEKEKDEHKKKGKFKNINLKDSIILDKYEKKVYKYDPSSDKIKTENLILDVLNNNFDHDMEPVENEIPKGEFKLDQKEYVANLTQEGQGKIRKTKKEELNIIKKENYKNNKSCILDYLHYDNFFHDENITFSEKSTSDDFEHSLRKKGSSSMYALADEEEFDIKKNVNKLLHKVRKDLNVIDFTNFIPDQFNMNILLSENQKNNEYESSSDENGNMESVLKINRIESNKKKMKEEMKLLKKYSYIDHLYSPGYCTRITQDLRERFSKRRINIYDLRKKKIYDKMREDHMEEEKLKREEENLRKFRLENLPLPEGSFNIDEYEVSQNEEDPLEKNVYEDMLDVEDNTLKEDVENEETYNTDSSISFDEIDRRSVNNLKKKYKIMKKSDNVSPEDLKRLKFYLCRKLNKKKYILKSMKSDQDAKRKKDNIKKVMKYSKYAGYNLLAKIHPEAERDREDGEETDELEEDLFDANEKDTDELNISEYTYSSLTISSYESIDVRSVYYNDNAYEKIFYQNDPKINVTYLYDEVDFFLIHNDKKTEKGKLFMEILLYDIKFYKSDKPVEEDALVYSFEIDEKCIAKMEKMENDVGEIILSINSKDKEIIDCCLLGSMNRISVIFKNITKRILLVKYVKYLNSVYGAVIDNAVSFFLYERSILDLKNVCYDKNADSIICSYSKSLKSINILNLSNRKMSIEDLLEFFTISNIKQCNIINLTKNPLFLDILFSKIKKDIDNIIKFFKNIKLKELILDFIHLSNSSGEYFISNLILNTNISFLSLIKCELEKDNITNIINYIKEEKKNLTYSIDYLNVEFNNLTYYDIVPLIKTLHEVNTKFKKLYICGNLIQTDIFDISFEFKRYKSSIEMQKYVNPIPNIFQFNNIYQVKNYFPCNLRGTGELIENDVSTNVIFELYFCYLFIVNPEEKLFTIRNISIIKKEKTLTLLIEAFYNRKEVIIHLNLFKSNLILLFQNIVKKSFLGEMYYNEQIGSNRDVNESVLNYFIIRSENEINFYHYNVTNEEIHYVLNLCSKGVVKNLNLGHCYLTNEDIAYFNSVKDSPYAIKVYKFSLSNNLINPNLQMDELIAFLSNFTIFFKINLSDLHIGTNPSMYELFFYLLNNTKCKIVIMDNCKLGNSFLFSVNKNIKNLNKNTYLNLLSLQYNTFNDKKGIIKFLNNIITTCKSIEKIRIYSNYLSEDDAKVIINHALKRDVISFHYTYDLSTYIPSSKRKVSKLTKNKINRNIDYNPELSEHERKIIEEFFQQQQNKEDTGEKKKDFLLKGRYNLNVLKTREIKHTSMR